MSDALIAWERSLTIERGQEVGRSHMSGTKPSRQLLRQEVVDGIKRYILEERLRPGDPLPTEPALCEALGASRSSVREAVKILNALDIVDVRQLFERGMADRIVSQLSTEQLDALDGLVATMRATGAQEGHGFVDADR